MPPGICLLFTTFGFLPVLTKPRVKKKKKENFLLSVFFLYQYVYSFLFFFSLFLFPNEMNINTMESSWDFLLCVSILMGCYTVRIN